MKAISGYTVSFHQIVIITNNILLVNAFFIGDQTTYLLHRNLLTKIMLHLVSKPSTMGQTWHNPSYMQSQVGKLDTYYPDGDEGPYLEILDLGLEVHPEQVSDGGPMTSLGSAADDLNSRL